MTDLFLNGADVDRLMKLLYRALDEDTALSLAVYCEARSGWEDPWQLLKQVLGQQAVYDAFGITSLPSNHPVGVSSGFEVIGTLANLLDRGGMHGRFVDNWEMALDESRHFLDAFYTCSYSNARAYSCGGWCDWFGNESIYDLDKTLIFRRDNVWWILAVTDSD